MTAGLLCIVHSIHFTFVTMERNPLLENDSQQQVRANHHGDQAVTRTTFYLFGLVFEWIFIFCSLLVKLFSFDIYSFKPFVVSLQFLLISYRASNYTVKLVHESTPRTWSIVPVYKNHLWDFIDLSNKLYVDVFLVEIGSKGTLKQWS